LGGKKLVKEIAIITTATLRPELLDATYSSFKKHIVDVDISDIKLYINIDCVPIDGIDKYEDVVNVAKKYFKDVEVFKGVGNYPKAVKKLYEKVNKKYKYVFDIQDDWELLEDVKLKDVIELLHNTDDVVGVTLNTHIFMHQPNLFCMSPTILYNNWVKSVYEYIDTNHTPEQQFRGRVKDSNVNMIAQTVKYPKSDTVIVKDIGTEWRKKRNIQKTKKFDKWTTHSKKRKLLEHMDTDIYNHFFSRNESDLNRIVIVTAVYKRYELTKYVMEYYSHMRDILKDVIELDMVVVGSEGEISRLPVVNNGFHYVEYANTPVSQKFNRGFIESQKYNPDAVLLIGSDDLINYNMFLYYNKVINEYDYDLFGFEDFYIYDLIYNKMYYWGGYTNKRKGEPISLGRLFNRKLLERIDYNLWNDIMINTGLDGYSYRYLQSMDSKIVVNKMSDSIGGMMVDIKTYENMWSVETIMNGNAIVKEIDKNNIYKIIFDNLPEIKKPA